MNRKSYENLKRWMRELVEYDRRVNVRDGEKFSIQVQSPNTMQANATARYSSPSSSPARQALQSPSVTALSLHGSSSARDAAASLNSLASLPIILVGTKHDMYAHAPQQGVYQCMRDYGLEHVYVSAFDAAQRLDCLDGFMAKVIQQRFYAQDGSGNNTVTAAPVAPSAHAVTAQFPSAQPASLYPATYALSPLDSGAQRRHTPFVRPPTQSNAYHTTAGGLPPISSLQSFESSAASHSAPSNEYEDDGDEDRIQPSSSWEEERRGILPTRY